MLAAGGVACKRRAATSELSGDYRRPFVVCRVGPLSQCEDMYINKIDICICICMTK